MIATDNTMVVAYINKQEGPMHSLHLLCLVVELFLWLQSQDRVRLFQCNNGPPVLARSTITDRVESPSRDRNTNFRDMGICDCGHFRHSPQHSSSPVYVSSSRASSTGDTCSVSNLAETVDVHVSTVSLAEQSHSETTNHSGRRDHSDKPWWPSQPWFPHLLRLCLDHPRILPCR